MAEERSWYRIFLDNFSIVFAFALVGLGMYTYRFYVRIDPISSLILFATSTFSMFIILALWRKFTERYAPDIIYWTTEQKWLRKVVAGGSFSYYEYKDNIYKIGLFEPISRFLSMMIAFIGIASTFAKIAGLNPESPVQSQGSAIIWAFLILLIPILLTPIVPIIWAMEDLQLKSWNEKSKTNIQVSRKYKARFNSFIAVSSLGVAFSLSSQAELDFLENVTIFLNLLQTAIIVLTYPIAVLTLLYYLYFRGTVIEKIRDKMSIPIAETRLIYRDLQGRILDSEGKVIAERPSTEDELIEVAATGQASPTEDQLNDQSSRFKFWKKDKANEMIETQSSEDSESGNSLENIEEEDKSIPQKIGSSAKNAVVKTGDTVVGTGKAIVGGVASVGKSISDNTIGRIFGKKKDEEEQAPVKTGGSATKGLWDEENETSRYKHKGGSATAGLWEDEKDEKKKKK